MNYFKTLGLTVLFLITGCGAMSPTIKLDTQLDPTNPVSIPCFTQDIAVAKNCALLTIVEISTLLEGVAKYDRVTTYSALGLATATGGVLAYDGSEDILKGLAVLSGALLGTNSVVNTSGQRAALEKGLKDMICAYRAADAVDSAATALGVNTRAAAITRVNGISMVDRNVKTAAYVGTRAFAAFSPEEKIFRIAENTTQADDYSRHSKNTRSAYTSLGVKTIQTGPILSQAVISIRAELRSKLAGLVQLDDNFANTQRDRIVDMTGEIIRKRSELDNSEPSQGPGADVQYKSVLDNSKEFVIGTAEVANVFRDCVDPATQKEIEN